jgi:light-regulated signal transduction histidine kinase (bacteriophytochrome)
MFDNYKKKWLESERRNKIMTRKMGEFMHDLTGNLRGVSSLAKMMNREMSDHNKKKISRDLADSIDRLQMTTRSFAQYFWPRYRKDDNCDIPVLLHYLLHFDETLLDGSRTGLRVSSIWQVSSLYIVMQDNECRICVAAVLEQLASFYGEEERKRHTIWVDIRQNDGQAEISFTTPTPEQGAQAASRLHADMIPITETCRAILDQRDSSIRMEMLGNEIVVTWSIPLLKIEK